ncbi:Ig-like domain-containing protein [Enterobacter hormaechei]|uniref:Ig-like domain-containing protein n=2 Tax=Enterobacter cloacae complex TaxID=354276 RepID=UPI001867C561|nr:Ig-like domain-containing protein [Enterobacter hormaechei]EKU4497786.1 Ig-like domain-containing protein [Enterobacter hormaechei]ELY2046046.1 Ig-like domain-containing protein [Enterobacter hormaechei]MBE2980322.1 Ig-like domain-containing protein [Enterobacter hormaechei]
MSNAKVVDVIIRKTAEKTKLTGEGNLSVSISSPSVIEIQGSAQDVVRYVRQGNDLLIYMKDGSVIRCNNYFVEDTETHNHSELVFNDNQELTHISFANAGEASGVAATELTAQAAPISSIEPFLEQGSVLSDAPWGWIAGAALGGGAIGALLAHGGDGETKTKVIDNTKEVESATPTFLLTDNAGDKQGVLSAKEVTDDNTPTFSGTGQPGATIQVKDSSGSTIASTMVAKDGTWTVTLPTQADGEHTWSVVQIDGSKTTSAGSITVTVSTADTSVTLATTAGDNVINASEQAAGFTLSGTSKNLAQGTALTVTLNGKTYSAEVGANGAWSVKVPAADAQALGDGTWTVNVSGKDAAGNTVTGSQTIGVDTAAPAISVDTIAQDNIINAAEHNQPLTLTGKTDAEAGQIVTVTLNGKNHTATVGSDGTWSVTLSASEVQAMANGEHTLTANVSDKAGNGASTTADFTVDTAAPVVTINTVAGDDILNTSEQGQAQIISGQANGAAAGDVVTVTVGGKTFTGVVQADGSWSVGVPASVIGALGEGSHSISVSVTDAAGNTGSATHGITLSGNPPEFTLDPISQDNVLNALEAMQPLSLSGTSNLPNGSAVTVTLNNVNYQATVENGSWSVQVPVSDVLDLANTLYTVSVSGTDSVGNSGSAEANLLVDTALPQVILNTFAGDNLVNNAEAAVDQTLSGRVTGAAAGDTVSVTVGGKSYTATVGSDLKWSVTIPSADLQAFGDGELTFSASVTNAHGNTGTGERDININAELPGLRVNTISGDDVINAIEQQQDLAVTGSSTHLAEGTQITVTINNVEYVTTVNASGSWQIGVPSADLQAWTAGGMTVSVSAEDAWGNTVAAEHPIELDLNAVAVTIDTVTTDDMLNAAEKGADVTLSGQTQGVEAGQTVVVKFADQTFTAQVQQDGSWRLTVPASAMETLIDGRAQVSVSVTNVNGNSADASRVVTVDTQPPAITLDNLTDDNIINAAEAQQDLVLSGSTTAEAGQTVTVTLNGKSYQTTVQADGRWQLNVPAADVGALTDGNVTVTATVSDVAGNSSSADRVGLVDATVPQVTINDFVTDTNTVNQLAHSQAQILSGSVTGAAAGDLVIITINNVDYTTVVDAAGNWSLGLPASVVQGLTDGTWTINVSVTDRSGNTGSSSVDVVVNTVTPVIGINTLAADDVINTAEKGEDLLLSGTSNQPEGTTITVNLNGINYAATTDASGNWSVSVPASAVSALGEANYTVTASVTDNVGNSASATHDVLVDSSLPVVTLNNVAGDNIVNAAEVAAGQTLTGKVSNAASGDTVTIIIGGQTYTATVQDDLTWSLPLTQSQLTALGNGDLTVSASVTNAHGNTGSSSLDVTIDAQLPGLRIDTVAGDDVINVIEHAQNLVISGTSTDLAAGSTVTVSINGKSYSASVLADGTWQAAVPVADVSRWADGALTISASAQDTSGNPVNIGTVVDVDLAPVAISINSVTDDNVLNAAEKGQDLVLSGSSSNVEAGQTVTIIFAGKTWATMVDANGDWTCTVPAAELSGLKDGDASVQVSVTNMNGNAASSSQAFSVDTAAPAVTINTISGDNMLNAAEAALDLTLSGTSTAEAGQTVTVTFNGNQYTAQVQANGSWTLDVPAADLAGIADGSAAVTATVSDKAGNPASAGASVLVDTTVPQITFNIVAGDDIVNIAEHGQALIVTGKVTGAQAGDVITLTLNGKDYTAMLDGAGNWSVGVPAADVGALANGDQTISATLTDKAGNSTSTTHAFDVSLTAPVIAITTLAVDDVINATERGQDLLVSGTSNQPDGTRITVTLNGISYAATTDASGNWSVTVPAANVSALGEASYSVTASVTDTAGNSANTSHSVLVDSALPQVTINAVATDDVINAAEVASGQTLSGKVSGAASGDTVTIGIGGNTYTATVQDDLSWSVNVASDVLTAIGNGDLTVTASVTNGHGNTGTGERDITIDASLPGLRVDTVAGDDVINSIEHTQNLIITGSSDGLASGSALTVTVNGKTYAATVLADGTWTAAIPAADVGALSAGTVTVTVDGQSAAGNPVSISHDVKVDLAPVAISIDAVATDDVINAAEKGADLVLSGSTTNVEENQTVNIIFGGKTYSATVDASGHWTATVPSADLGGLKDGDTSVQVSVTNVNGNSASAGREYSVDATAPTVSIEIVSDNNIINAAEAQQDLVINGVSDAEAGQTVTVTLNGENYTTTMQANGSWSVTVPSADVGAIADGDYTITAAVQDKAGNPASADRDVLVDTTVPQLTINAVSDDDVINSAEHAQALIVTGSVTGAAAGDVVTVTINNKDYTATLDASGKWNVGVPAADVSALTAGDHTITAALTDKAGNSNSTTHEVEVNLTAPVLTIDTVSGDDVINNTEKTQDLTITGTASGLAAGAVVTVMLNGKAYSATVATNGQWTTTVPASEVGQLGEALYTVSASATDSVGNSTSTSHTVNVESVLPGVIINTVAGDDVINAAELATGQTISGKVVNAEAGNTVTVTIGGNSYTATVQSDLTWSVSVPESVLTALGNGDLTVSASVTNGVGNSGTGEREIVIDANLPGLRVDTVAGDDVINSIEHGQNLIITGSSDGLTAGTALTVTVNGKTYAATVLADGTWSAAIPSADVSALAAGTVTVTVEGQSSAGNPVTINHDVTVDLANVAISIDAIASDDVINAAEKGEDLVLSGTTSNVEENQTVTITFGGKSYTATVDAEGKWTATVPSADLTGLKDGDASVQVSVTNVNGNSASAGREYSVDATAPSVTINTIATDDILNASEAQSDLAISGTSTAEAGQTVTVSLNGKDYTTTVSANGSWTLNVPAADLAGLTDGSVTVTASVSDKAGNPASVDHTLMVDVTVPAVTIHTVAGDDVINVAEHKQAQIISGSATGAAAGDKVTVTIGGQTYTTVLDAAGNWSVGVPANVISGLSDGTVTVTASVTDAAGNTGSGTHNVTVDTGLPSVSFNAISDDNVLNAVEKGQDLSVSGTSANLTEGTVVTVILNGKNYTATTAADGTWSLTVPAADLAGLGQASYTLNATATNGVGNSVSNTANLLVDTALPTVTINTVAGDNVINAAEVAAGQTLSGTVANAEAGNTVTVTIGGLSYTATVQNNLSWSVNVPSDVLTALGNGSLSVTATVTNGHGNTGTGEREIAIDANLPGLRVNTVAGDDVINTIEHAQNLIVSGSSDGLAPGTALTVTVNGKDYAATVLADGTWRAAIPSTDVSAWPEGTVKISVTGDSAAGNPITISHDVTVDLATVAISINVLATDDVINAAEKGADLVLSGATTNVEAGQTVTISLNGRIYTTTVDDSGNWTYTVPSADLAGLKDGDASVQVSVTNVNGNSASAGHEYSVDATAPSVTINTIATDDILNASEAQSDLAISGTSTAEAGQTLTVSLNGKDYTTTVSANGSWTLNVPAADLAGLTDGSVTVTASVSDKAGNPASVDHTLTVDVTVPAVTIHTVAGDDVINAAEHNQAQIVSGSATGAAAGDKVTVTIGGQTYTTVLDAAGNWSVGVPANVISVLSDGTVTVTASVTDAAGNTGSGTHNVTVDTGLPSVSFNAISDDNVLNAVEKGQDLSVSGTSANLAEGTVVTVILNGKNYTATTAADGTWSLTVPAADLASLGEANYTLSATATNGVGNSVSNTANLLVDTALPTVTINTVAGDNVINAAEVAAGQTLSGRVTNAEAGNTVTVTIGGNSYTATVQSDLTWSVNVPESVLTALGNGDLTVSATVTNDHGNSGTGERDITIDASLPGLRVDTVAGDDVINSIEHGQNLIVTGSSDGLAAGTTLTVTLNGKTYAASVLADGSWTAAIPAADVGALAAGTMTVTVAGQSAAGNPVSISHDVTVDLAAVAISIDAIATDDVINAAEKGADLVLSGSTSNVEENQTVTITFGGRSYTAKVDADGNWTASVPSSDLAGLKDGDASVQVSITNAHGNSASAGREYSVDATAPTVTIDTVAGDNVINGSEAAAGVAISGTTTAEVGQTVTVTFGGNSYTAQVQQGGVWSVNVPGTDLSALADNGYTVQVSVSDAAGNPGSAGKAITLDTTPPTVSFNVVAGDDVINSVEHGQAQIVSGTATGASVGDKLIITIGSNQYTTTVDASGKWSVGVPASVISALADGTVTLSATITDSAGNSSTQTHDVVVNTASVALTVNTLSGDDVINAAEAGASLVINGSSAQFASGTQVTITLNGKSYTATIQSDGAWQTTVPAADVGALADGASYQVSASAQDSAGNSASATHTISVDTTAPVISVNTLSGDDVLNAAEAQQPLTVHGSSSAEAGQTVTVTLGGKTYTALVGSDGTWTLDVPAADLVALSQGALTVTAVVNDKAGNSGQTTHTHTLTVDTVAPAVTISTVADDDIVNNAEQLAGQTISGTTTAEQGQTVTVSFNGHSYQATVGADGSWSVFVPGRDFLGLSDGDYTITATVSDKAGNPGSATHDVTLNGDVPTIVINTFAQDDIVNAAEHGTPLIVSGTTDAPAGQTVTITLNGKTYTATVQNDGTWSYTVGSADVTALADGGSYVINAQVSNAIGNSASDNHSVTVDLTAPSMGISIDSLQNDTGLSASDFITNDKQVVVNGSLSAQLGNNEKAQISLDGGSTWIDLTVTGTTWRYTDGRTLTDGTYPYQVRVIDNAGNVGATDSQDVVIDLTKPAATSITVDSVSQDTGLSDSDFITSDNQISLKGTLGAALGSGDHAQISLDGGATWTDVSVSGLSWTYVDGRTLADGDYNYQLRVIDDAGNISATTSQVVTIDTVAPDASKTIAIDSISDDTGLSSSDFITNDTSLTLHGSLGATLADGEYAQISIDGGVSWQNVIVTGNSWYYVDGRTLGNQTYDYYVRVVDAAGNVGASAHQQVMVDTVAPDAAITVTVDNITVDTGFDNNDFLTSSTSYTLNGTLGAELGAGEYVQVSMDGGTTWVYATVSGTRWSYNDARTLADGDYRYQVRVVDQAGNVGATTTQDVTVDTQAPQYGITIDSISEDTGQSGSDFITMDTSLTINGSLGSALASDERVQISLDGGNTWIDTAVTNQRWSYTDTRDLADGDYTWQVRIIDQAGNVGSTSSQVVTVDTTPPETVGTVVSYTDGEGERTGTYGASVATDDTSPLINGTLNRAPEDGEIVQLYRDGILLGQVTMNGSASWSYQDNGLLDGNHTYILRVTDKAGNYTESDGFVLNVDTSIPTTTAAITAQTTSDTTPIINGTVSADLVNGEYLVVMVNGKTYTSQTGGAVVVDPDHNTWYLQIPDSDALSVANYDVTAQVKSSAGNGNTTGTATGSLVIDTTSVNTDWATTTGNSNNSTMTVGTNSSGLWNIIANGQSYSSSDSSTYAGNTLSNTRVYYVVSQTAADFDRNGTQDIFATENTYAGSTQVMWTYDGSSYTASQLAMGTTIWYGGVIAYDKTGDGYLDLAYGDAGMDSLTYLVNTNGVLSPDGTGGEGGFYGQFDSGREISGVDLNNDGTVDIVQHTNRSGAYSLTVINNNGNGTLSIGQNLTNVFVANASNTTTAASMTWADFNGDGYMDLYLGSSYNSNGGVIYYNDGTGQLSTTRSAVEASNATAGYLSVAVDWNGDGQMDIIKLSTYGGSQTATLFTNNGYGSTWTSSQLASGLANVTGVAAVDYNWDGAQDLLVSQQNGKVVLVQNNAEIADGTAMHLHIVDSEGINAYYGNTVNLYNAAGVLVASQIINAQSGIGSNDTSAQVSFYGLDPNETYSAEIVKITNGVSDNVTWTGLDASNGKEGYVLTAEAATGGHSGTITGTGYNDTFIAEDGTYTYNGSGGWNTHSDYDTWSNTGGMDVVDYRNATSGITVDLRLSTAQDTGFGTTRLLNIEGINGSDYDDVITGNSGDNQFEGRGGNDTFNIGSGGQDTLLYKLINASDATGGNGSDVVNGFTVGTWEGTADTDRIDLRDLLSDSGYTGTGSASYVNGVATLDSSAGNIADYIRVVQNGSNTEIQVDLDGTGGQFSPTTLVTLNGVQTDLATLLANHQLLIA